MTDIQAESDRRDAEHACLVNTPLPDGWLELCMDAGFPGLPGDMSLEEAHRRIRAIVNTVLPLHEQQVREQVAAELEAHAVECHDLAEEYLNERSAPLTDEAEYFATAASYIRSGGED